MGKNMEDGIDINAKEAILPKIVSDTPERKPKIALARRLSRRLSIVAKVPALLNAKLKQELGAADIFPGDQKVFDLTVIAPDKTQRIIQCQKGQMINNAVSVIVDEFSVKNPKFYLAGSLAIVEPETDVVYLYDNILIIEEEWCPAARDLNDESSTFSHFAEKVAHDEMEYVKVLNSAGELYDNAPGKTNDDEEWDLTSIFKSLNGLATGCNNLINDLKTFLAAESISLEEIGCCFNDKFWEEYNVYFQTYKISKRLLRQRKQEDEQFIQQCRIRQGAAKYSLEQIVELPVQRLSEYERYFETLLAESRSENQCNVEEINNVKSKCKQAAKRGQRESDLERIQDLFPNDCLRLYDADALTMKVKGLMRKRSGAAARLQRALSTKSLRSESPPSQKTPTSSLEQRTFLMEAPVQFSTGVQSQDRHLFLFNDLLLIAKARSGGNFKLKEKVRISEIWLTKCCLEDVSELNRSEDTSFVMGWPTTNVVVTFSTQAARDLWWAKLREAFRTENEKEPCSTNIQVTYYDVNTNIEYCKTFSVSAEETARDCIRLALEHLEMRNLDCGNFQLWVKTARDEAPYPLIGHERPFAIKLSCLRDGLSTEDGFDLDHCNNIHDPVARCHFILRNNAKSTVVDGKKNNKKSSTRTMKIGHVFRRSKDQSSCLFGIPLCKLTDGEALPKPIMSMLNQVFAKGPFMQGIFRKSANARQVRELRDKLDAGVEVTWEHVPVLVTAALLKDFLRSLPDPLLTSALYPQWRAAVEAPNLNTKLCRLKGVLGQLPKPNHLLLIHFLCVLYHIARRSCHTLMSAANLGVCVGPSLLWSDCPNVSDDLRIVPSVVECLITHCEYLCGSHVSSLLGDLRDSGTEESDSMKRDDSSIDSLECSPPPRKDKMSLSRDSGLTMSDSQLYTPDEEESGSTSSSGYDPAFESHTKVSSSVSMPVNYVRVYGGWEDRLNPNHFQRQAWFRQRSRRMNQPLASKNDVRRTASEESLLDNSTASEPPPAPPRRQKAFNKYEQTPMYPRKSSVMVARRLEVPTSTPKGVSSTDSEAERSLNDGDRKSVQLSHYRKESNVKSVVPTPNESFMLERRSIPLNALSIKCESANNLSTIKRPKEHHYSNICLSSSVAGRLDDSPTVSFGSGEYYYAVREQIEDTKNVECGEDSSTLSDEDCTPHVSRSNSRGNEVVTQLRYAPPQPPATAAPQPTIPAHSDTCVVRGRVKRRDERAAHRSRSLPPPPPYRPPPPATSRRAPITSYYLGDCNQIQNFVITRTYKDEESYV